ncbi:MAG: TonB-dependent receptor plug domain-containing protein [Bacteroidales bacterium]|nr:TonB-dependent receptor plug domain-containing protein [Bacteroidales bacterium]
MIRRIIHTIFFALLPALAFAQRSLPDSLALAFHNQLEIFPQEKIYVHTDKPYYISGEKIWFRAYLVDAVTHIPSPVSRYVYVELINPLDSVVTRVKIREVEEAYYGHLPIPNDVPQGDYTLRAYTTFMRSIDEDYFFTKTIHIGDPQARTVHTETQFFFESARRVNAAFRFSQATTSEPYIPKSVKVIVNEGRPMNLNVEDDGTATINFNLRADSRQRVLLLEITTERNLYRQFIPIPTPEDDFDVSFYPEGGSLMLGTAGRIAFKAMKSNGQATTIAGVIYSQSGSQVGTLQSGHLGMGSFMLLPQKGERYYALCENDMGQTKRFELPVALDNGYALSATQWRGNLNVSVIKPEGVNFNDDLYLLGHTRGILHFIDLCDHQTGLMSIPIDLFPSGVLHLVLFDSRLKPVSERLVFINNNDQAQAAYQADKESYTARSLVKNRVTITDPKGQPLTGSFSVSVTSDREVSTDSTTNILTQLLLTSDLKGYIQNPAYYFQDSRESANSLDLLMLTQGWRRYNMAGLAQGRFTEPSFPVELGSEVSGSVKTIWGRAAKDVEVMIASLDRGYFNTVSTDSMGRFQLSKGDFWDSTRYVVSIEQKRGLPKMELILDEDTFPKRTLSVVLPTEVNKDIFSQFADKAERQYLDEGGIRVVLLPAAVAIADQKSSRYQSHLYNPPSRNYTLMEDQLDKLLGMRMHEALRLIPGVRIVNLGVDQLILLRYRPLSRGETMEDRLPLVLLNDMPMPYNVMDMISMSDIARIDVILPGTSSSIFGPMGYNGVISIFLKDGRSLGGVDNDQLPHIKPFLSLGYQQPVEFYAPKYETDAQRFNGKPDLRTTIHWQPVVQTNSLGVASFEYYTADESTSYTLIIEGLADNGSIIYLKRKMRRGE